MPKGSNPRGSKSRKPPVAVKNRAHKAGMKAITTKGMIVGGGAAALTGVGLPVVAGVAGVKYHRAASGVRRKAGYGGRRQRRDSKGKFA